MSLQGFPDCMKCQHFYVTWDQNFPRGCRIFDFKTAQLPSHEIFRNTGKHCPSFSPSPKHQKNIQ